MEFHIDDIIDTPQGNPLTKEILQNSGFVKSDMFSDEITEAFYTPNNPYLLITPAKTTTVVAPARNYVNFWLRTVEELQQVMRLLSINIELKL